MDFYSKTQPDLISPLFKNSMNNILDKDIININNNNLNSSIINIFNEFYDKYIANNLVIVVIIIFVCMLMLYRYYNKDKLKEEEEDESLLNTKDKKEDKIVAMLQNVLEKEELEKENIDLDDLDFEEEKEKEKEKEKEIKERQEKLTKQFNNIQQPQKDVLVNGLLTPKYSYEGDLSYIMAQQPIIFHPAPISYPPDPYRVISNNDNNINTSFMQNLDGDYYKNYINPNNNLNVNDKYVNTTSVNNYNGTYNSYLNAQDTQLQNPIGLPTDFNSTTGNFVGKMTDMNKQNILDYNDILNNTNRDLLKNINNNAFKVDPPYNDM
jgi:hypothetical protein